MRFLSILAAVLLIGTASGTLLAQTTGRLAGRILTSSAESLTGANVLITGTSMGAAADLEGDYFINNVPPGVYSVRFSMIGFQTRIVENVEISIDRTTRVDVRLDEETVTGQEIVVEAFRAPPVQKDRTYQRQTISSEQLETMPVNNITELLEMQAGVLREIRTIPISSLPLFGEYATAPSDGFHFRGGREGESVYLFDGVNVTDALWGGFNIDQIGELTLDALEIQTGTFGPQHGEGMSAVIQMATPSLVPDNLRIRAKVYSDALLPDKISDNTTNGEVRVEIPIGRRLGFVGSSRQYATDGYLFGYIYPEYVDSDGVIKTGEGEVVPMQYQDEGLSFGKFIAQPTRDIKLELGGFLSATRRGQYHHFFKYNPFGTPRVSLDSRLLYARINHMLSTKTFYEITLARYERDFRSRVYDNPELYAILPQRSTAEFSIVGEDWVYFDSGFDRNQADAHLTSQLNKVHQVRVGATGEWLLTAMERYNPDPSRDSLGVLQFGIRESYEYRPRKFAGYVLDKMEFDDIGMVLNLGLRIDVIDPNRTYPADISDPLGEVKQQPARSYLSPRIGVSFPIAEQAAFRFGYGSYYQFPDFFQLYQGANRAYPRFPAPNVISVPGAIASDDIKEEHTVNYEAGLQLKVSETISLDATAFYRESSDLIGIRIAEATGEAAGARFPVFENIDFATVKGIELSVRRRLDEGFGGFLNYTYSRALVTSSVLFEQSQDVTRTFPALWDRPHVVSVGAFFVLPGDWGGSAFGSISSGTPYTFSRFDPNGERAPMIVSNDLMVYKGFDWAGTNWRAFVQVRNLIDRRNVWWVYADSGIAGKDANDATSDDYTDNPAMWGPGRRVQLGVQMTIDRVRLPGRPNR